MLTADDNDRPSDIAEEIARLDRLRQKLLDDASRATQAARSVEQAAQSLRLASGTREIATADLMPPPPVPAVAPVRRRGRPPRVQAQVPTTEPTSPTPTGDLHARIREELTRKSMTSTELASALGISLDMAERTLYMLSQAGQTHYFQEDGKYTWCVGLLPSHDMQAHMVKLLNQHHMTRGDMMHIFGVIRAGNTKKDQSHVGNNFEQVRRDNPMWAQEAEHGHGRVFWLVGNQKPPKNMDGSLPHRVRKDRQIKKR